MKCDLTKFVAKVCYYWLNEWNTKSRQDWGRKIYTDTTHTQQEWTLHPPIFPGSLRELSNFKAPPSVARKATNNRENKAMRFTAGEPLWGFQGPGQQQGLEKLSADADPLQDESKTWAMSISASCPRSASHEELPKACLFLLQPQELCMSLPINSSPNVPEPEQKKLTKQRKNPQGFFKKRNKISSKPQLITEWRGSASPHPPGFSTTQTAFISSALLCAQREPGSATLIGLCPARVQTGV